MLFSRIISPGLKKISEAYLAFLLELALRIKSFINPSAWPSARRIESIHKGDLCSASGEVAVFASSYIETYPEFFLNLFEALRVARIDLMIMSNRKIADENVEILKKYCRWLVIRENIGRDFGAYADSLKALQEEQIFPDRLYLFNDSLYYRSPKLLGPLLSDLRSGDFTCATVSLTPILHAQSFCMSFSKKVLTHPFFCKYWAKYFHINTRRWAISKGELGFSLMMRKANFSPQPVFSSFQVARALLAAKKIGKLELIKILPQYSTIHSILSKYSVSSLVPNEKGTLRQFYIDISIFMRDIPSLIERTVSNIAQLSSYNKLPSGFALEARKSDEVTDFNLTEDLLRELFSHSQIHSLGLLLWRHGEFPLMKRDIIFRSIYSPLQIDSIFEDDLSLFASTVKNDLIRRQEGRFLRGIQGFLFRRGFI